MVSSPAHLDAFRARVDAVLTGFLRERRAAIHPAAIGLLDRIEGLVASGGRRLRPAFAYWGFRAAGGADGEPIVRAAASLELIHTMALIHDDLIDQAGERRGAETLHRSAGPAVAIVAGDLAAVLADELLLRSGFDPPMAAAALERSYAMREEMAAGQMGSSAGADPREVALLKGGGYTVAWPLRIGAALARARPEVEAALAAFGEPLGAAFQMVDDLRDGEAGEGVDARMVQRSVDEALAALARAGVPPEAARALEDLASVVVTA
jgi:geranylgeranyl diphosphate synthase type I